MKIRIKFSKNGPVKFIGHLDLMRYFQKAMRRADIDIVYSEGYSPHQIMSFASPLGVGLTSDGEYLDIEVGNSEGSEKSVQVLNNVMADGIIIKSYRKLPEESKNAMSIVAAADYRIAFRNGYEPFSDWTKNFLEFYAQDEIRILKKTKKNELELDIKPYIYSVSAKDNCVFLKLASGSVTNIKPELVFEAFAAYEGFFWDPVSILIHRMEIYAAKDTVPSEWVPLEALAEEF